MAWERWYSGEGALQLGVILIDMSGVHRRQLLPVESIVSTIGSSENYKVVLENPNQITQQVLNRGLDQGTAFEILSIDIADVI